MSPGTHILMFKFCIEVSSQTHRKNFFLCIMTISTGQKLLDTIPSQTCPYSQGININQSLSLFCRKVLKF